MSVFPGTFIETGVGSSAAYTHLVDNLMTPRLLSFRMIHIHDEPCELNPDYVTYQTTFGNWLPEAKMVIRKNGVMLNPETQITDIDAVYGTFQVGAPDLDGQAVTRDVVEATYVFDYFPQEVLEGFLTAAISIINTSAVGPSTNFTIDTAPTNWEGVIIDTAYAMAIERLLLDYDLWRYRLVFAIGPNEVEGGGGDIAGQLTTLKQNAEQRAEKTLDNPKFKCGNYLAPPTTVYFNSIRGAGVSSGRHGVPFVSGRLRGWIPNKMI